jgi:short-subunit dehydrogenase
MAPTPLDAGRRSDSQLRYLARFGPCAVVTGASSGIGRAFATELAACGFDLVLVGRRKDVLDELAGSLTRSHGIKASTLAIDLGEPGSSEAVLRAVADREVGLLVCSAGFGSSGSFIDGDLADECAMVDVNCRFLMALTWHFARKFAAQRRGGIVLMSSLVGFQGVPRAANYAATKAYVQTLAEGLHHELHPLGVSVIACAPGPIHSGFAARATMKMGMAQGPEVIPAPTLDALGKKLTVRPGWLAKLLEWSLKPLPRWGRVRMMGVVMAGMAQPAARQLRIS